MIDNTYFKKILFFKALSKSLSLWGIEDVPLHIKWNNKADIFRGILTERLKEEVDYDGQGKRYNCLDKLVIILPDLCTVDQ